MNRFVLLTIIQMLSGNVLSAIAVVNSSRHPIQQRAKSIPLRSEGISVTLILSFLRYTYETKPTILILTKVYSLIEAWSSGLYMISLPSPFVMVNSIIAAFINARIWPNLEEGTMTCSGLSRRDYLNEESSTIPLSD